MNDKDVWPQIRCLGSATVSPRGQVVIPAPARRQLDIDAGTTLLVFVPPHGQGLLLLKADAVDQIVSVVSEQLTSLERLNENYRSSKATDGKEG